MDCLDSLYIFQGFLDKGTVLFNINCKLVCIVIARFICSTECNGSADILTNLLIIDYDIMNCILLYRVCLFERTEVVYEFVELNLCLSRCSSNKQQ